MTEENEQGIIARKCEWSDCEGLTWPVQPQPEGHWRYYNQCESCGRISCQPLSMADLGYGQLMRDMMTLVNEELPLPEKYKQGVEHDNQD